jgi:hypothetical protein
MVDTIEVPAGSAAPNADGDDAWTAAPSLATNGTATLSDGGAMSVSVLGTPTVASDVTIVARITNPDGTPATLLPWLGMSGHAIVVRHDGKIFMHVHPMGTASMAAQDRLLRREAGDTVNHGEQQPRAAAAIAMPMHDMHSATGEVRFPVAFPAAGAYRVLVQVRRASGQIETVAYDINVPAMQGR